MTTQKIQLLFSISLTLLLCACGGSTPIKNESNGSVVQQKTDRATNRVEQKVDQKTDRTIDRAIDNVFKKIF